MRQIQDYEVDTPPARPTIILAKHEDRDSPAVSQTSSNRDSTSTSPAPSSQLPEKPVMVLKSRDEGSRTLTSTSAITNIPAGTMQGETPPQTTFLQRTIESTSKLSLPLELSRCVKLIDDQSQWCEQASECLLEQTDFLVVGVVGLQGSGKSTVLSLLAGNTEADPLRNYIFPAQTREVREECGHMTNGIDIHVTSQRVIFLDTQPLLSASVLDQLINNDKKIPPEFTTSENFAEIQCLQHVMFLLTVCNVILVVQDWFTDTALLDFLKTAEMLKPSTPPSPGHDGTSTADDQPDFFPHVVFLQNKAKREDFTVENFTAMQKTLSTVLGNSKLKMKGDVAMTTGRQSFSLNPAFVKSELNMFLLPRFDANKRESTDQLQPQVREYQGHPSFQTLINSLRGQILSMPREQQTHTTLTEKNWFHYAARMWDSIKKSQILADYNRLLP
ncbi:nonsense-mediated mRNA decay factor SMG9-like isoform X2 [Dreissena polymorpha]|uniref:nonsense-mediated mRNA decay factor SMG9-like isoform X2 n=1 Tax=Dreissena polymorpha TaxID=45954 RepID=UPI0022643E9B|nr:nonsense-mediated mRNA decay factor SMG9-like isoform X2 [Dreissena polymorpha]